MITDSKWHKLKKWMASLGLDEKDIDEKFITASGSGGQKLHKTASCVYLKHLPTGLEIKCQDSRLREENRYLARRRLCEKVDALINKEKSEKQQQIAKLKRQKRKRSKRAKEKILADKAKKAGQKKLRQAPKEEE